MGQITSVNNPLKLAKGFAPQSILNMKDVKAFAIVIFTYTSLVEAIFSEMFGEHVDPLQDCGLVLYTDEGGFRVRDKDIALAVERLHGMMQYKKFKFVKANDEEDTFYWRRVKP